MQIKQTKSASRLPEARRLAADFWRVFARTGDYRREVIARLAEMATSKAESEEIAATTALFTLLVERLADSFEPQAVRVYNRLFAQVIEHCRHTESGKALDVELHGFGLRSEDDLVRRVERLCNVPARWHGNRERVKRVLLLSRVTIGADVAITSVVIERVKREFPAAEIVLIGGAKLNELFGGDARIRLHPLPYERADTTIHRLLNWLDVLRAVRTLMAEHEAGEVVTIDPDSRLTQLGLLPIAPSELSGVAEDRQPPDYLFFPSRQYRADLSLSLGELTRRWLDEVFGHEQSALPRLSLMPSDRDMAKALSRRLKADDNRKIVTLNFGVGNNVKKRVGDAFEKELVASLLQSGVAVILDKGAGEDELQRADAVRRHALGQQPDVRWVEADERNLPGLLAAADNWQADLLVWQGRLGLLAAMIAESALYLGYDSAGQHIAAALGVGCIDVMAGFTSPRVVERWRPTGTALVHLLVVDRSDASVSEARVLADVLKQAREILLLEDRSPVH